MSMYVYVYVCVCIPDFKYCVSHPFILFLQRGSTLPSPSFPQK